MWRPLALVRETKRELSEIPQAEVEEAARTIYQTYIGSTKFAVLVAFKKMRKALKYQPYYEPLVKEDN